MLARFSYKSSFGIIELYRNNEIIYPSDDNKTLGQTDDRDRIVGRMPRALEPRSPSTPFALDRHSTMGATPESRRFER